jgi:hypothetical protein
MLTPISNEQDLAAPRPKQCLSHRQTRKKIQLLEEINEKQLAHALASDLRDVETRLFRSRATKTNNKAL